MNSSPTPVDSVTGGSHGVVAGYDQLSALAATGEELARRSAEQAGLGARIMADPDLIASGFLSPVSFAKAQVKVLDATTGPRGLTRRSAELLVDALAVRACVLGFRASDAVAEVLVAQLNAALGRAVLVLAVVSIPLLPLAAVAATTMTPRQRAAITAHAQGMVRNHPQLVQHLVAGGGSLLDALVPGPVGLLNPTDGPLQDATIGDGARLLAVLFGNDTSYRVTEVSDRDDPLQELSWPADLPSLMGTLQDTGGLDQPADEDGKHPLNGAIRIQRIGEGESARHIVYLPGTDDMSPIPDGSQARDMLGNYQLLGSLDSSYRQGVVEAMRAAGAGEGSVMLVGHSQGGMVAAALAGDPQVAEEFSIRQIVTAGSPSAQVPELPPQTQGLHLENRGDVVPLLDGADNPDQPNRVTVQFTAGQGGVTESHGMDRYVEGARAAEGANDGSIDDALRRMGELGFISDSRDPLPAEAGEVRTFRITRG